MKPVSLAIGLLAVNILAANILVAAAQAADVVRITPLGSHEGEFCAFDRAMVFEDPDGTRILYDAGRAVRGPDDPRLGKIDVVLHLCCSRHLGERRAEIEHREHRCREKGQIPGRRRNGFFLREEGSCRGR